jgi:fumarate hydratase subunit alpha
MREITTQHITDTVRDLCVRATRILPPDVSAALDRAAEREESPQGRAILEQLRGNARIAAECNMPLCQDTGLAVFFLEVGQDAHITGGSLEDAVHQGVRLGYKEGYNRNSVMRSPIDRVNTGDNTPAIIHTRIVPGDTLSITFMAKGGGSENMSRVAMLKPSDGVEGVKDFIVDCVEKAWANPCPPIVVGVGLGGTFEKAALMAKHSLLRPLGGPNADPALGDLEKELLDRINALGIGPQGLGGRVTALAVHIESHPCHLASLPVAVNIECHSHRHAHAEL